MNFTSFFPGFHHLLFGRPPISQREALVRQRANLGASSIEALQGIFSGRLPTDLLCKPDYGTKIRERIFSPAILFWAFLSQVLSPGSACREAVSKVQAFFKLADNRLGWRDGGLLPTPAVPLKHLRKFTAMFAMGSKPPHPRTAVGDARRAWSTTPAVSMPDTLKIKLYSFNRPGCGFPVMVVALFP